MRWLLLPLAFLLVLTGVALAQDDDDRGRLTRFLESQLSQGEDMQVRIDGFRGALSSQARLDRLTISDREGEWLVLEDAVLDWQRTALFRGELRVQSLTAERLTVLRPPAPPEGPALPEPAATPFALPELPVAIEINQLAIRRLELGAPVVGMPAELSLTGQASLEGGSGVAQLRMERLDSAAGTFSLAAAFDNATRFLDIDLLLEEAEGGLVAGLLGVPEEPSLRLTVAGEGPLTDLTVDLSLATDGIERVDGTLRSLQVAEGGGHVVEFGLSGDLSPLLATEYRGFFGQSSEVSARVERDADGATRLEDLRLATAALLLEGEATLDAQGRPVAIDVSGRIADPAGGGPVRLPVAGAETTISSADIAFDFDAAASDAYSFTARLDDLSAGEFAVNSADVTAAGRIVPSATGVGAVTADLTAELSGVGHADPALARALGDSFTLSTDAGWEEGGPILLESLLFVAGNLTAEGSVRAGIGEEQLPVGFDLAAVAGDLSRFSGLAGQDLSGALRADLDGTTQALSGAFDIILEGTGQDLAAGETLPPSVLPGETRLRLAAQRDEAGTRIEDLTFASGDISASGTASIGSVDGAAPATFEFEAEIADLSRLSAMAGQELSGSLSATFEGTAEAGAGHFDIVLDGVARDLRAAALPPQLLAGETRLRLDAARDDAGITVEDLSLDGSQITLDGSGRIAPGGGSFTADARLADLGLFTDTVRGPATVALEVRQNGGPGWVVDADLRGPAGLSADVAGTVGLEGGRVDVTAQGEAPLAIANQFITPRSVAGTLRFDLALRGQPGLGALSGTLTTTGARFAAPTFQVALEDIGLTGRLQGGRLSLEGGGTVSTGGRVGIAGSLDLGAGGVPGEIGLTLDNVRLVDPTLYELRIAQGDLTVRGQLARAPLVAGRITLGETELRVPESGLGVAAAVPDIAHLNMTTPERRTLAAAGFLDTGNGAGGGGSGAVGLDIEIVAPGRIFLRGRGIDAEFGGSIRIGGTTANVIPAGRFELIRGRISILGTRLDIVEGAATLQGDFDPYLVLRAESRANGYRITITVEGPASSPDISLSSDPFLPEDEILAQLLFGRSVSALSPVQLIQLADAASSLAGGRSDGGLLSNLREGLGLDDLDLQTDAEGNAAVRAGRYISENIYTDVTIGAQGESEVSLNIDLTPSITARGSFASDGGSSLGVFFERDY
jgi:translocation and assembly module TamB